MTYSGQVSRPRKLASGVAALVATIAVGLALGRGLDFEVVRRASEAITAITLPAPPMPRDAAVPAPAPSERPAGKASAANKQAKAAAIAAPPPKLPPLTPPAATAPKPGSGDAPSAGAAPAPGPGSGAGGRGDGTGAGGSGTGTGGGTKAVWQSGMIRDRDYPRDASRERAGGEVEVRFTIEANGRVTGCRVTSSSGNAMLDQTTCELIEARFRFRPATDATGQPVASVYGWRQRWWLEPRR